jgi:hypothetical protein
MAGDVNLQRREVRMAEIGNYKFGEIEVDGKIYTGDIKIVAGSVISNWWRREGHVLAVSDVEEILSDPPQVLVVGMGLPGLMKVDAQLRERLASIGTSLIERPTPGAVAAFNDFTRSGGKVAGAFHLTC